jgi:hypothetical protein
MQFTSGGQEFRVGMTGLEQLPKAKRPDVPVIGSPAYWPRPDQRKALTGAIDEASDFEGLRTEIGTRIERAAPENLA